MANMNTIIHDMEGTIEIGDTFKNPRFRASNHLQTFDRVVSNPMWNQDWFKEQDYDADELGRFPQGAGFPGAQSADWGWVQHILASLNGNGRAAIVLDTGAASRGSGDDKRDKEREVRKWIIEQDLVEGVIYLPDNLFYNTPAAGILLFLRKAKPLHRRGRIFVVNAAAEFIKGRPKNLIPPAAIERIGDTFSNWLEVSGYSRVVELDEVRRNQFNLSPTRYVRRALTADAGNVEHLLSELRGLSEEAVAASAQLDRVLRPLFGDGK
jgi:type I restriction enzyme M protein